MIDLRTYVPRDSTIAEVEQAIKGRVLMGLWKRKIREAGGEVVMTDTETPVGAAMAMACGMHSTWPVYRTRLQPGAIESHRVAFEILRYLIGTMDDVGSRDTLTAKVENSLWPVGGVVAAGFGIAGRLHSVKASMIGGEDTLGVLRKGVKNLRPVKLPKFVVVFPRMHETVERRRILRKGGREAGQEQHPFIHAWRFGEKREKYAMTEARGRYQNGVRWDAPYPANAWPRPEELCDIGTVLEGLRARDLQEVPVGIVGMVGSGVVASQFHPGAFAWGRMSRDYRPTYRFKEFDNIVWFHASVIEIVVAWGEKERIDWEHMLPAVQDMVKTVLRWRELGTKEERPKAAARYADLTKLGVRLENLASDAVRQGILGAANARRTAERWERRKMWTVTPEGKDLKKELRELVDKGVLRAGYVTERGEAVVLLPKIRFTEPRMRMNGGVRYEAGVYEMEDLWLWLGEKMDAESILALGTDGRQHPHPHVYRGRGGTICWGRTDREERPEDEMEYDEYAINLLFTKGWEVFVDAMVSFFGQWHDDPMYRPIVAISTRVADLPTRE